MSDSEIEVVHIKLSPLSDSEVAEVPEVKPEAQVEKEVEDYKEKKVEVRPRKGRPRKQKGDVSESGMSMLSEKKLTHLQNAIEARKQKDKEMMEIQVISIPLFI
jgi:hypothetical protein